jgi:hypothetical protein
VFLVTPLASSTEVVTARISPVLTVAVNHSGIVVLRLDGPPEYVAGHGRPYFDADARYIRVGLPGLSLLVALAREAAVPIEQLIGEVSADLGLDESGRADLVSLVDDLVAAGLLHQVTPQEPAPAAPVRPVAPSRSRTSDVASTPRPAVDGKLICPVPAAFPLGAAGFVVLDHDGRVAGQLSPAHLLAAHAFEQGRTVAEAHDIFVGTFGPDAPGLAEFRAMAEQLVALEVLREHNEQSVETMRAALTKHFEALKHSDDAVLGALDAEIARYEATGTRRVLVIAMDVDEIPPLSLGMVLAYAQAHDNGALEDRVAFAPLWNTTVERLPALLPRLGDWPTIFLFSHYAWTSDRNLAMASQVKAVMPNAITIHGGPSAPKYEGDAERWFAEHPQVDVAVRGEGEVTLAEALDALGSAWSELPDGTPDLEVLADVAGLSYRTPDGLRRTADRDRIADLDTVPSPYLAGIFERVERFRAPSLILETNRGCPYGCTFCDWGSATLSRIRKFDLDRVKGEMEWAAKHKLEFFMVADANFGMLDRDVEIVEWAVELKKRYGAPSQFWVNYAKNKVGNLAKIVQILREGGIGTQCVASVQSFDAGVLKTIRRSNIKIERYDALTDEFRRGELPLETDIMLGLPGSTVDTLLSDLQAAIDRELQVRALPLQLLVNSPMNDPEYRAEHGIVAAPDEVVQETNTYTRDDWWEMMAVRRFFYFAERSGLLRQLATHVRAETAMREIDFYQLVRETAKDVRNWPHLAYMVFVAPDEYLPPGSWWPVIEEFGRFMVEKAGVPDDSALQTVLAVQHALLPARNRRFPSWSTWITTMRRGTPMLSMPSWPTPTGPGTSTSARCGTTRRPRSRCAMATGAVSCCPVRGQRTRSSTWPGNSIRRWSARSSRVSV